ncbi:response regulator receiver protein [Paraburkholderia phymatum]|uniref:response regulator receiver protein n=1 Tax=Paraburkholderia phymatum TaxID=148447 RepID=UPI00316EFBB1
MLTPGDKRAYDAAVAELDKATEELQRLAGDPATSLAALARAQHHYDLSRVQWLRCHWQLRIAAAHALPKPPRVVRPILVVGDNKVVRDSLAVLLKLNGYLLSEGCGFDSWLEFCCAQSQHLIVLDVPSFASAHDASAWFVESFNKAIERPHIIALVWPKDVPWFAGRVDEVITKPHVFEKLRHAIDRISSAAEAPAATRITANPKGHPHVIPNVSHARQLPTPKVTSLDADE